jgi:protein ImuB
VVEAIEDMIPRVEVVSPGLVLVPIAGAVRFYGGEQELAERLVDELDRLVGHRRGGDVLVGVADGPFAARWAAAVTEVGRPKVVIDTIAFLSGLDLAALREQIDGEELIDTFRWLGVSTLGELARLPREALLSRFGNPGLSAHRLASGEDRPVDPREIAPDLAVDAVFEEPLETLDAVAFAARALAERMLRGLRASGVAPHRVSILAEAAEGEPRERIWRSADPFTEKALSDRVWWQLRAWVESGGVPGGISRLRLAPADLSDEGRQLGLLQDESSRIEAERALARAQTLLGPEGVLQGRAQGGRMPQERVVWSRWGEPPVDQERDPSAPWPGSTPAPSPALVPPKLQPLEVEWDEGMPARVRLGTRWEPVLTWSGPWRLGARWWAGEGDADRYQLVTSVGAFLCVVAGGRAFLAGVYD